MFNGYRPSVARRLGKTVLWSGQKVTTTTTAASSKVQFKNFSPSRFANLLILPLLYKIGNGRITPVLSRLESVEDSPFTYFCRVFHKQPSTWQRKFRKNGYLFLGNPVLPSSRFVLVLCVLLWVSWGIAFFLEKKMKIYYLTETVQYNSVSVLCVMDVEGRKGGVYNTSLSTLHLLDA